jgi:hypothetical protein
MTDRSAYGIGGTAGCSSKKRMSSALASGPRGSEASTDVVIRTISYRLATR